MDEPGERLKAFCSVTFDDCFVIRDLKIIDGTSGAFVAMPSRKLTSHCPKCHAKNHLRAAYCNSCGLRMRDDRAIRIESLRNTRQNCSVPASRAMCPGTTIWMPTMIRRPRRLASLRPVCLPRSPRRTFSLLPKSRVLLTVVRRRPRRNDLTRPDNTRKRPATTTSQPVSFDRRVNALLSLSRPHRPGHPIDAIAASTSSHRCLLPRLPRAAPA